MNIMFFLVSSGGYFFSVCVGEHECVFENCVFMNLCARSTVSGRACVTS